MATKKTSKPVDEVKPVEQQPQTQPEPTPVQPQYGPQPQPGYGPQYGPQPGYGPQPQKANVYYDKNGQPVFIHTNTTQETAAEKEAKKKKTGAFVGGIITTAISVAFTIFTIMFFYSFLYSSTSENWAVVLLFILYLVSGVGLIFYIPALGTGIAGLALSITACKSSKLGYRIVAGICIAISALCLTALIFFTMFMPYFLNTSAS